MTETKRFAPAPGVDPDFDKIVEAASATLDADPSGVKISAEVRRETIARGLTKYGGKTYTAAGANDDIPWKDEEAYPDDQKVSRELVIPEPPDAAYWYEDPEQAKVVEHFILMRRNLGAGVDGGLLIVGGAGYGKTLGLPHLIARMNGERHLDLRMYKMDCAVMTDPQRWFGRREVDAKGTRYEKSDFIRAVEDGYVIQLDEINRIHPRISDSVHALLDGSQALSLSDLNITIKVNPLTCFIATMNIGSQYGGTYRLDHAFRSRFATTIEVGPPPREEEITILTRKTGCDIDAASNLVDIAEKSRQMHATGDLRIELSTRDLVAAARWVAAGMTERQAFMVTAIPLFDGDASGASAGSETDRAKIMAIIDGRLTR